mgnify:CR=1 FL=1
MILIMKKRYLIISFLTFAFFEVNAQCTVLSARIALQIQREFAKTKILVEAVKKKDVLKKICGQSQDLDVFPIFWMRVNSDSNSNLKDSTLFFKNLRLVKYDLTPINDVLSVDVRKLLYEGIIYDKCSKPIVSYSEAKQFYIPAIQIKNLFEVIKANDIICAFYIVNLDKDHPYFLVNNERKVFVYYNTYENTAKPFVFEELKDYFKQKN